MEPTLAELIELRHRAHDLASDLDEIVDRMRAEQQKTEPSLLDLSGRLVEMAQKRAAG